MSMRMPRGSICCWKGHSGGCGGWAEVGIVMGIGCGAVFQEKVVAVKPVVDGVMPGPHLQGGSG
jgi:hypothetical protein